MPKGSKIRVRLKSYDHRIIDDAAAKIVEAALTTGAKVVGPIPLPTKKKKFVVLSSPHVDKNAREHFQIYTHQRLVEIIDAGMKTIDGLQRLDLPAGVEISIKM